MSTKIVSDHTVREIIIEHKCKDGYSTYRGCYREEIKTPAADIEVIIPLTQCYAHSLVVELALINSIKRGARKCLEISLGLVAL